MVEETRLWIEKILQQLAAESYLDNVDLSNDAHLVDRLKAGANNYRIDSNDPDVKGILEDPGATHPTRMLTNQAEQFTDQYEIIHHLPNRSSGFSATLMRNKDTGEYTLSFRSTEFRDELNGGDKSRDAINGADTQIANHGFALGQLMQMEDYYQFLINDSGLIDADTPLDVTGYSLGGQLATAFTALHPDVVNQAYVFNGVGLGDFNQAAGSLQTMISDYRELLIAESQRLGESFSADMDNITAEIPLVPSSISYSPLNPFGTSDVPNLYATASHLSAAAQTWEKYSAIGASFLPGQADTTKTLADVNDFAGLLNPGKDPELTSADQKITQIYGAANQNDTQIVANQGINSANEQAVYIEDQPNWVGDGGLLNRGGSFGDTHSIILILDSLLLTEALQTLDNNLSRASAESMYAAATASLGQSSLLGHGSAESDSLETILDQFLRLFHDPLMPAMSLANLTGEFGDVEKRSQYLQRIELLKSAAEPYSGQLSITSLTTENTNDWLHAAVQSDSGLAWRYALVNLNPFVVTGPDLLYSLHSPESYALYEEVSGNGLLTEFYLRDRAVYLQQQIQFHLADLPDNRFAGLVSQHYQSISASGLSSEFNVDGLRLDAGTLLFDDYHQNLTGTDQDDRLYAGAQDNVITPGGGDDYIEGGQGFDRYVLQSDSGFKQIFDHDGRGEIIVDGEVLTGGALLAEQMYRSDDGRWTYWLEEHTDGSQDLWVNNELRIQNYSAGDLGIHLLQRQSATALAQWSGTTAEADYIVEHTGLPVAVDGGAGHDLLSVFSDSADQVKGGSGNDWLYAGRGDDWIEGGAGDDRLMPGDGADVVSGGAGNDFFNATYEVSKNVESQVGQEQRFWMDIGQHFFVHSWADIKLSYPQRVMTFTSDTVFPLEDFTGVSFDGLYQFSWDADQWTAHYTHVEDASLVFTLPMNQVLTNIVASDGKWVSGGDGQDYLLAGHGDDYLTGDADDDKIFANDGNDVVSGGQGRDLLLAGYGDDLLIGGQGDDMLIGDAGKDRVFAGEGDDIVFGDHRYLPTDQQHDDRLYGEAGNDYLVGHGGNDYLDGGSDTDTLKGETGNDHLYGRSGDDQLFGGDGDDLLDGGSGKDLLIGDAGEDRLMGGFADDELQGGEGNDALLGGQGNDRLLGGNGIDTYYFNRGDGRDVLNDVSHGNRIVFGHGIAREDLQFEFEDPEERTIALLTYGEGDQIRIENFQTNRFNEIMFKDDPQNALVFSALMPPVYQSGYQFDRYDTEFFNSAVYGVLDTVAGSVHEIIEGYDSDVGGSTYADSRLRNYRDGFYADFQDTIATYLIEDGYALNKDGILEKTVDRRISQIKGHTIAWLETSDINYLGYSQVMRHYRTSWQQANKQTITNVSYNSGGDYAMAMYLYRNSELTLAEYFQLPEGASGVSLQSTIVYETEEVNAVTETWWLNEHSYAQALISGTSGNDHWMLPGKPFMTLASGGGDDFIAAVDMGWSSLENHYGYLRLPGYRSIKTHQGSGVFIDAGQGNDKVIASYMSDFLVGGTGNDVLRGLTGNDTYYFNHGSGHDVVYDGGRLFEDENLNDRLLMPENITFEDLTITSSVQWFGTPSSYEIPAYGQFRKETYALMPHQALTLSWSVQDSVTVILPYSEANAGYGIDYVVFDNGTQMRFADLVNLTGVQNQMDLHLADQTIMAASIVDGGPGDDVIFLSDEAIIEDPIGFEWRRGFNKGLVIGGQGHDQLFGSSHDDILIGAEAFTRAMDYSQNFYAGIFDQGNYYEAGKGRDEIWTGSGNDVIVYRRGDGDDQIQDSVDFLGVDYLLSRNQLSADDYAQYQANNRDTLIFADMTPADLNIHYSRDRFYFHTPDWQDSVKVKIDPVNFSALSVVAFADGTLWERNLDPLQAALHPQVDNVAAAAAGFHITRAADMTLQEPFESLMPDWVTAASI